MLRIPSDGSERVFEVSVELAVDISKEAIHQLLLLFKRSRPYLIFQKVDWSRSEHWSRCIVVRKAAQSSIANPTN